MNRLRHTTMLASLVALAATAAGVASAADVGPRLVAPSPVAVFDWSGPYVGMNGGYGWGDANASTGAAFDIANSGGFVGGQIGANFLLSNNFLLGVEGDLQWADISGSVTPGPTVSQDLSWFGSLRGRVGLPMGSFLPYLTGGFAFGGGERSSTIGPNSELQTHTGYVLGGGLEFAWTKNLTTKLEYQYLNLGAKTYSAIQNDPSVSQTLNTVRVGVNFKY